MMQSSEDRGDEKEDSMGRRGLVVGTPMKAKLREMDRYFYVMLSRLRKFPLTMLALMKSLRTYLAWKPYMKFMRGFFCISVYP